MRRPHLPRELAVRELMADTGVDLTTYGSPPRSEEDLQVVEEEDFQEDEEAESECEDCDDPCFSFIYINLWECVQGFDSRCSHILI